jgi:hypothetical protein
MTDVLRDLVARLGGDFYGGSVCVPGPGHSPRDRSLSVTQRPDGRLLYHSFAGDPDHLIRAHLGLPFCQGGPMGPDQSRILRERRAREQEAEARRKLDLVRRIWGESLTIHDTPAETYLQEGRALRPPWPVELRFHPSAPLDYRLRLRHPALVTPISAPDGRLVGVHVTALQADGLRKADLPNPRRILGSSRDGAIRLGCAPETLAVAEGVETALSFRALHGVTTWSAISTAGLRTFTPPRQVRRLIIAADGDAAGHAAAEALKDRLGKRLAVRIDAAPQGADWNDVLQGAAR